MKKLAARTLLAALCILVVPVVCLAADDAKKATQVYARGVQAESAGRLDEAVTLYTEALSAQPQIAAALKRRGRILQQKGQQAAAAQDFTAAVALAPADGESWKLLGDAKIGVLEFTAATAAYQRAIQIGPATAALYRNLALAQTSAGQKQNAIESLNQCVRLRLDNPEPYLARGRLYAELEKFHDAIEDFDRALALQPEYPDAYFARGHAQGQLGNFDRAVADFNLALKIQPDPAWPLRADTLAYRGAAYDTLGQNAAAMSDYTDSFALKPDSVRVLMARSDLYARQGNHSAALADRNRAVQLEPNNANAFLVRGGSYHMLGQHEKGLADRTRAIELNPRNAQSWLARGSAYFLLHQNEKAIVDLEQAQRLDPSNAEIRDVLSRARDKSAAKPAEVKPEPAQVAAVAPERAKPAEVKPEPAQVAAVAPEPAKPVEVKPEPVQVAAVAPEPAKPVEAALLPPTPAPAPPAVKPVTPPASAPAPARSAIVLKVESPTTATGDANSFHNTGRALLQQNKFPEAIEALTRAVELRPSLSLAWNARGYAYMRLGQWAKAVADFDQALRIDPNYQNAKMNRDSAAARLKK